MTIEGDWTLRVDKGYDATLRFEVYDDDGSAKALPEDALLIALIGEADDEAVIEADAVVETVGQDDVTPAVVKVALSAIDTDQLRSGHTYQCDLVITEDSREYPLTVGSIVVRGTVKRQGS